MGTKNSSDVFFLLTIASRMPGPHSLTALSVAMRAKSSSSKNLERKCADKQVQKVAQHVIFKATFTD